MSDIALRCTTPLARRGRIVLGVVVLLATSACSVETKPPALPNDIPAGWRDRTQAEPGLRPDLTNWWHAFHDGTLDQLIEQALHENLTLHIASERLKAARALRHRARSEFWPNLNFRTFVETAPNATSGYLEMGFDSTWEFGFFGRAQANSRIHLADQNTAVIDAAAARVSVIAEVTKNYVELRAAQAREKILTDIVAERRKLADLMQVRMHARMVSRLEANRAKADWLQALGEAGEPKQTIVQTEQALGVLIAANSIDSARIGDSPQPSLPALDIGQTPADLLRTRPEIRRAEQNVLRAAGELGIARADLYPRLGISGTLISSTVLTGDLDRPNRAIPIVGPTVSLPIVDWSARRQIVNAREAALSAAVLAYREAVLEGVAEVESALAQLDAKKTLVYNVRESLDLAEQAAQSAQTLQRVGLGDGLDTASAQLALAQSRLQETLALRDQALAYIALYKALGGTMPAMPTDVGKKAG